MNKMGNSKTVYRTILRPLLIVVLVEICLNDRKLLDFGD